jgi:hypothetical protein
LIYGGASLAEILTRLRKLLCALLNSFN